MDNILLEKKKNLPWVEKYRPDKIENIISHKDILNTLINLIDKDNFPHVIFYGPPGTGKTTTILACAKHMFGSSYINMVLELNGSDDRGINIIREQIKDFSQSEMYLNNCFNLTNKKHKLVILDEADSMTFDAQFALRRVIETYTNTTRFCLICNYSTKIIPSLQSRCIIFRFSPIPHDKHLEHINNIIKYENIKIDDETINEIINLSDGDMRKSLNILQSLNMNYNLKEINLDMLYENIGVCLQSEKIKIINTIIKSKLNEAYDYIKLLESTKSISLNDLINDIVNYIIKNKIYNDIKIAKILIKLSEIQFYLSGNINISIQLCAIICVFKNI
jgi:replication factor C subunit 3/5